MNARLITAVTPEAMNKKLDEIPRATTMISAGFGTSGDGIHVDHLFWAYVNMPETPSQIGNLSCND